MSLANCHAQSRMNPLVGVALTNMIPVTRAGGQLAVFRHMARINHSCQPNCNHYQVSNTQHHRHLSSHCLGEGGESVY